MLGVIFDALNTYLDIKVIQKLENLKTADNRQDVKETSAASIFLTITSVSVLMAFLAVINILPFVMLADKLDQATFFLLLALLLSVELAVFLWIRARRR